MRSTIFVTLSFFAAIIVVLQTVATADPWITGVTPRLVGRGTTSEIVIAPWGHEAVDVLFYPQATYAPWSTQDAGDSHGIRCVGTNFDVAKKRLICKLEVAPNCRPGEHPFRVLTDLGLSSMGTIYIGPFPVVDEGETKYNTNDTFENAMRVEQNITVRGTLSKSPANDIDCFRLSGKAGERLSVEVDMAKMGDDLQWNPVPEGYDSVVAVFDPHGKRIAINDDSALNRQDPLLSIQLPVDGEYSIVLRRSMFVPHDREYALHIGNYFRPLTAFPLGGHSGRPQMCNCLATRWARCRRWLSYRRYQE